MMNMDEEKILEPEQLEEVTGGGNGDGNRKKKSVWIWYKCDSCKFEKAVQLANIHKVNKTCPACGGTLKMKQ